MSLMELESHKMLHDALEVSEYVGRIMQTDLEEFEHLFSKMDEQRSKQEQIGELFKAKIDVKEESELLEELNNMETREVEGQLENLELEQRVRAQKDKEKNELEELERQLEEMTIATETEERKQQYA